MKKLEANDLFVQNYAKIADCISKSVFAVTKDLNDQNLKRSIIHDVQSRVYEALIAQDIDTKRMYSYISRMAHNYAIDCLKERTKIHYVEVDRIPDDIIDDVYDEEIYELKSKKVKQCFEVAKSRSEADYTILLMTYQGYSLQEIADELGKTVNAVNIMRSRLYKSIRERFEHMSKIA